MVHVYFEIPELKTNDCQVTRQSTALTVRAFENWLETNPRRLIMSYTEGGIWGAGNGQFRVWDGIPANFEAGHVDSCGENMLLHVAGDRWAVREFRDRFIEAFSYLKPVTLPNGVILYLNLR